MGFLIDAVATWFSVPRDLRIGWKRKRWSYTNDYLAEFNNRIVSTAGKALDLPVLSLVVRTLKREVRASGECLGMYRR